jgi:hypothetical protein
LFKTSSISYSQALLILGFIVLAISTLSLVIRFPASSETHQTTYSPGNTAPALVA